MYRVAFNNTCVGKMKGKVPGAVPVVAGDSGTEKLLFLAVIFVAGHLLSCAHGKFERFEYPIYLA